MAGLYQQAPAGRNPAPAAAPFVAAFSSYNVTRASPARRRRPAAVTNSSVKDRSIKDSAVKNVKTAQQGDAP
jgi:hypothetical protein